MKRIIFAAVALVALGTVTTAVAADKGNADHQQKVAGAYRLSLQIGPAEAMSMQPKGSTGELMLGGKMGTCRMSGGMAMGSATCNRHVEVHVYNRRTGKVITGANVTILLTNDRTHRSIRVPIMTMRGARMSMADLHYGNNIYAASGTYTVTVSVNRTAASFQVRLA